MRTHYTVRRALVKDVGRVSVVCALAVVLAAELTSCGGSAKANSTASSSSSSFAAYSNCMKAHGVTLPANFANRPRIGSSPTGSFPTGSSPTGSFPTGSFPTPRLPAGVSASKYRAANTACRSKLPSGRFGGHPNSGELSRFAAFSSCLSSNGVKLNGTGPNALANLNRNDPTVQAALKTCSPILQSGSTTTTTTG